MTNPADTFRQEATDLLEVLERNLLELENDPDNRETVDVVFRALHTIKGSGEMFGYSVLANFVHHLESAFEHVRSGTSQVTSELIDAALGAQDHIATLLNCGDDKAAAEEIAKSDVHQALLSKVQKLSGEGHGDSAAVDESPTDTGAAPMVRYTVRFKPEPNALRNGMRPDLVEAEMSQFGTCTGHVSADQVPPLEELEAGLCYLGWELTVETDAGRERIEDIFLFFDDCDLVIEEQAVEPEVEEVAEEDATPAKPDDAVVPAADARPTARAEKKPAAAESVRVQADRLDELMDQLGELVIAQARLNRISERIGDSVLANAAEEIERLVTGMRDATLSIRMLPIAGVFGKFRRVVRDLSTELGKNVHLDTEGGETELDKNIIDRLSDPLVHIIRNAVDHGVEDKESRAAAGKPEEATIRMVARQSGGEVHIEVSDDGGGLKTEAIRKRALERGLIDDPDMPDEQVHQLIFAPGFSTAQEVSHLSGRGVGMDAVRSFIEDLRGAVDVRSTHGEGTSVTLRLPLTLAIIDGLLVRIGAGNFVLPLASVEECVELSEDDSRKDGQRSILIIRDEFVPYLDMGQIFGFPEPEEPKNRVVIVNADGKRVGLMLDDVIGQYQTVIKSLSAYHRNVNGLAGCTILGDGSVALIIDPAALIKGVGIERREVA